ncbi:MAG: hypothetical protein V4550_06760 [Gemmatimonadota bacterium]
MTMTKSLIAAAILLPPIDAAAQRVSAECPPSIFFEFQVENPARFIVDSSVVVQPTKRVPNPRNLVQFVIDTAGVVMPNSFKVLRATDAAVVTEARETHQRWHYQPATIAGRPVCQFVQTPVDSVAHRR